MKQACTASAHPPIMLPTKVVVLQMRPHITCHAIHFSCMLDMCTFSAESPSPLQRPRGATTLWHSQNQAAIRHCSSCQRKPAGWQSCTRGVLHASYASAAGLHHVSRVCISFVWPCMATRLDLRKGDVCLSFVYICDTAGDSRSGLAVQPATA